MGLTLGLALYFVIWWTVLFAVLPLGVRTQGEAGDVVPGTPASAPARPRMVRVLLITTLSAAVIFGVVWAVLFYRLIDLGRLPGPAGVR
jgi:predicted secreted protein